MDRDAGIFKQSFTFMIGGNSGLHPPQELSFRYIMNAFLGLGIVPLRRL
ncbi:13501_t:CDS:2, partial [Funneliformis caledonium]